MKTSKNILPGYHGFNRFLGLFILALTVPLLFAACSDTNLASQSHDLQTAKEQWETLNIEDYSVEVERNCFCPAPRHYTMSVEKGEIVQILDSDTGEEVEHLAGYSTIDELFSWLEQASSKDPEKLVLEFHSELGYPTFLDYNQSDRIADEELLMRLENLQPE